LFGATLNSVISCTLSTKEELANYITLEDRGRTQSTIAHPPRPPQVKGGRVRRLPEPDPRTMIHRL
jgi:hypothetical protein